MEGMTRADRAEFLFRQGYNCSQTVVGTYCDVMGMSLEAAALMSGALGAGVGKMREVCGAVSGMALIASHLKGYSDPSDAEGKKALYKLVQDMCAEFEKRMDNTIVCRDLLGIKKGEDLAEPAVRTEEYYQSRPCIKACRVAAEIVEEYLNLK